MYLEGENFGTKHLNVDIGVQGICFCGACIFGCGQACNYSCVGACTDRCRGACGTCGGGCMGTATIDGGIMGGTSS